LIEPKPSTQYVATSRNIDQAAQPRAVSVVLPLDWAQAVTRLQQLHNEGCTLVRIMDDDQGRVRVEPDD
jgi:hypothetical protein